MKRRARSALARAEALRADGRFRDAIDTLAAANRAHRDVSIERELISLRYAAFPAAQRDVGAPRRCAPQRLLMTAEYPPAIAAEDLTGGVLASSIHDQGCLQVKQLVPSAGVQRLREDIDCAFYGYDANARDGKHASEWFTRFEPGPGEVHITRPWLRRGGGVFTADSPRTFFDLLDTYEDVGLIDVITAFLGERPVVSLDKCTLRRVRAGDGITWHQDGAFLGSGVPAVNVWLSLSKSGASAPGLEIVPRRFDAIVDTGTDDAEYPWSVASSVVETARAGKPLCRPVLDPGDALLFDGMLLHRTSPDGLRPDATRYAIETWFFAPSSYPAQQQVPLIV